MKKLLKVPALVVLIGMLFMTNAFALSYPDLFYQNRASSYTYYNSATKSYNCLGHATGSFVWEWPWGSSLPTNDQATVYLQTKGHSAASTVGSAPVNGIISYGTIYGITHFARVTGFASVSAKWGNLELFEHNSRSPYPAVNAGSDQWGAYGYGVAVTGYN